MKYLITISYDGSKFSGLQKLNNENTVQGELEKALTNLNQSPVFVKSSGRTDKGVHALNQKCHFELNKIITPYKLRFYLNNYVSNALYIKDCKIINDDYFHARFSVKSKTYEYKINCGEYDPIMDNYVYNYNKVLNVGLMEEAAKLLSGPHSYRAFVTGKHKTYDSIIDYIKIEPDIDMIKIEIKGKAFYTYMIRNIVSILILIGSRKTSLETVNEMLKTGNRIIEYPPAPANGLYLKEVIY